MGPTCPTSSWRTVGPANTITYGFSVTEQEYRILGFRIKAGKQYLQTLSFLWVRHLFWTVLVWTPPTIAKPPWHDYCFSDSSTLLSYNNCAQDDHYDHDDMLLSHLFPEMNMTWVTQQDLLPSARAVAQHLKSLMIMIIMSMILHHHHREHHDHLDHRHHHPHLTAIKLAMVPLGTNRPASLPRSCATCSWDILMMMLNMMVMVVIMKIIINPHHQHQHLQLLGGGVLPIDIIAHSCRCHCCSHSFTWFRHLPMFICSIRNWSQINHPAPHNNYRITPEVDGQTWWSCRWQGSAEHCWLQGRSVGQHAPASEGTPQPASHAFHL